MAGRGADAAAAAGEDGLAGACPIGDDSTRAVAVVLKWQAPDVDAAATLGDEGAALIARHPSGREAAPT